MEINDIVLDYINKNNSDYAIMIDGEWGAGKTHYWENCLKNLIESRTYQKATSKEKAIKYEAAYISLFGLSDISELSNKVFVELNPFWKKKGVKIATNLSKVILNKSLSFIGIDKIEDKEFQSFMTGFEISKNKVLCFDDLERLDSKILNEVFGYINLFTEHDNLKVIILCNEKEIAEKVPDYNRVKEKLVRFTYKFNPNIYDVFDSFLESYDSSYKDFISKKKEHISELYNRGNHKNLRTLRFNLDLFEKIYDAVCAITDIELKYKRELLDRFLYVITAYAIEYKIEQDKLKLKLIQKVSSTNYFQLGTPVDDHFFGNAPKDEDTTKQYDEIFKDKYLPFHEYHFDYYSVLATYVHSGVLDKVELRKLALSIENSIKENETSEEYEILQKFNNLLWMEDDEFFPVLKQLMIYVREGSFDLFTYPSLFNHLVQIERSGINGFEITPDVIAEFHKGIEKGKLKSSYINSFDYRLPFLDGGKDDRYEGIKTHSMEANRSLKTNTTNELAERFATILESNDEEKIYNFLIDEKNLHEPIFQFLDPQRVFDSILSLSNKAKRSLDSGLEYRYRYKVLGDSNSIESSFFSDLLALLTAFLKEKEEVTISSYILKNLSTNLEKVVRIKSQ